jgi:formamidopyrimidine-DNA glycosylase
MPELPEVEVLRRQLSDALSGALVTRTVGAHPRYRIPGVTGAVITAVSRRGKYLFLALDDSRQILLHLGMTGQVLLGGEVEDHVHLRIETDRGYVIMRDPRRFGSAKLLEVGESPGGLYQLLGQEPLDEYFNTDQAVAELKASSAPIKARLLSQRAIAGVGNYIADEALHRAGVHPARRSVGDGRLRSIVGEIRAVVNEAVTAGGVSERDYRHLDGGTGTYQSKLRCYGRTGLACVTCSTALQRIVVAGRGSTYCSSCQRR